MVVITQHGASGEYPKPQELENWSEMPVVKMAQIDYPIGRTEGFSLPYSIVDLGHFNMHCFDSPCRIVDLSHFNMHF